MRPTSTLTTLAGTPRHRQGANGHVLARYVVPPGRHTYTLRVDSGTRPNNGPRAGPARKAHPASDCFRVRPRSGRTSALATRRSSAPAIPDECSATKAVTVPTPQTADIVAASGQMGNAGPNRRRRHNPTASRYRSTPRRVTGDGVARLHEREQRACASTLVRGGVVTGCAASATESGRSPWWLPVGP